MMHVGNVSIRAIASMPDREATLVLTDGGTLLMCGYHPYVKDVIHTGSYEPQDSSNLAVSLDGRVAAYLARGTCIVIVDVWTGAGKTIDYGMIDDVHARTVALSPDGSVAFCGTYNGNVLVIDAQEGETFVSVMQKPGLKNASMDCAWFEDLAPRLAISNGTSGTAVLELSKLQDMPLDAYARMDMYDGWTAYESASEYEGVYWGRYTSPGTRTVKLLKGHVKSACTVAWGNGVFAVGDSASTRIDVFTPMI